MYRIINKDTDVESDIQFANGEYKVRIRKRGHAWDEDAAYFTDDKQDAINTQTAMVTEYQA